MPEGRVRWGMALLLGLGVVISYFDRINMSVAALPLSQAYGLNGQQTGLLLSSYLWSYALMQIPVGALLDRFGVRRLLGGATFLWALATLATSAAPTLPTLILARVLLGVAEAPAFPGAAKAVSLWFPRQERGLATSAFDAAAKFSNVIGTPLVGAVVGWAGWRAGFWMTGLLTAAYGVLFWQRYRDPVDHPRLEASERAYIAAGGGQVEARAALPALASIRYLLAQRPVWGLMLGFGAYGYSFYMLISWLPTYLAETFHMDVLKSGLYTAVPWGVATVTDVVVGGWLVDRLIAQGHDATRVRKTLLAAGMLLGLAVVGAAFTHDPRVAVAWIAVALGGLAFAAPVGWSLPGLIAPPELVGTLGSLMNLANNAMGALSPIVTGWVYDKTGSFAMAFGVAGTILLLGVISYWTLLGPIQMLRSPIQEP
ncbi:MAG TPA: MFS transporter [Candidatus Xenobia bacterium]|jgi:MFS family permease